MSSQIVGARRRIFVVDDHPMMRRGLAELIVEQEDLCLCGEAENANEALAGVEKARPDLVLIDISLPGKNGLELIKDLKASRQPPAPVLVFSMHDESLYAERVLRAGGRGYVMKSEGGKKLLKAIRQVLDGQIYVSDNVSSKILEIFSGRRSHTVQSQIDALTDREFQVFQLIGKGMGTCEIANELHVSSKTVEVHRANIKSKLKLKTASELLRYAIRWLESEGCLRHNYETRSTTS